MKVEVVMPKMGESIQEGTVLRWLKREGDTITKDETILEISTDKVDSDIPSPAAGILSEIIVGEQTTVPVGTVIAYIETQKYAGDAVTKKNNDGLKEYHKDEIRISGKKDFSAVVENRERFYSPLVRMIAVKEGVENHELGSIKGSGSEGRITKHDILDYLEKKKINKDVKGLPFSAGGSEISNLNKKYQPPLYEVVQMNGVQKRMAERMTESVSVSPHVTIIDEVNMTSIVNNRLRILEVFIKQEGYKLTYTPFFAFAVVKALKDYPALNSSIEQDCIVYKKFINLGIAVASASGLIVPVIKEAENLKFKELAKSIDQAALRTRSKKISPDEVAGGTFTITNYGVFGSIIGTPIIVQPQVAILGIGAVKKRPVVLENDIDGPAIGIQSMVYLTLTFDHRIIDGAMAGQFLSLVKRNLENFNFEEVN